MQCYGDDTEDRNGRLIPAPKPAPARVSWHGAGVLAVLAVLLAILYMVAGCSPLPGPGGRVIAAPSPERWHDDLRPAAAAIPAQLDRVQSAGDTIRSEVAGMVKTVREVKAVAPTPADRIEAGHKTIYAAAQDAQAAALEARAQVGVVQASAAGASAELQKLREAHAREVEALGQRVESLQQEVVRLREEADSFLQRLTKRGMALGGVAIAVGVGLFFAKMGVAVPLSVIGFGVTLLAVSALLQRIAGWIVPTAGVLAGLAVVGAVAYAIRHWQAVSKAGVDYADTTKAAAKEAVKTDGLAATHLAEALKAVKDDAIKNVPESVQREIWNLRKF